jgi:hypothetical protein
MVRTDISASDPGRFISDERSHFEYCQEGDLFAKGTSWKRAFEVIWQ